MALLFSEDNSEQQSDTGEELKREHRLDRTVV